MTDTAAQSGEPDAAVERRHRLQGPVAQCVDLHMHSDYSDAPKLTLDIIEQRALELGIGVSVTDHNEARGSLKLCERGKILCLPGIEVGSREKLEVLCYFKTPAELEEFYRKHVEPYKRSRYYTKLDRSFTQIIPAAKEHGALVSLPHPFGPSYKNVNFSKKRKAALFDPDVFGKIDMIEVINGHMPDNRNFKAYMLSEIFEKRVSAGSDAHVPEDIGRIYLRFDREEDVAGVFELLQQPIKLGMTDNFSAMNFAKTSRRVIPMHLRLFFSKKHQRQWMMKLDDGDEA
ncbi:PHP domain-containing protein [bacterium]|nr:PHP domain-containing protein [bacterium]